jgi:hypothetical protein
MRVLKFLKPATWKPAFQQDIYRANDISCQLQRVRFRTHLFFNSDIRVRNSDKNSRFLT